MIRHITLYYASISLKNTVLSVLWWLVLFWRSPAQHRARLTELIGHKYHEGSWFVFGSARSGLAAFLNASGVGQGDEVIISSYTCLAVPTAIVAVGATPVYIDINPRSLSLDEKLLWSSVTARTKAIIVQHTLGNPAPIVEIQRKAIAKGLLVIEDCALSLGTKIGDQYVGTLGDAAIFSMELSKTLSSGWGGLLLVNNTNLVPEIMQVYDDVPEQGIVQSTKDLIQTIISTWCSYPTLFEFPGKYVFWLCEKTRLFRQSTPESEFDGIVAPNFVEKMGGAQTLLAILQWQNFRDITDQCAANHDFFCNELKSLGYLVHCEENENVVMVANRVSFLVKNPPQIIQLFKREKIELGVWFDGPLSPVPTADVFNYQTGSFPSAEHVASHAVNIPCHNRLSVNDKKKIVEILRAYTKTNPDALCVTSFHF
jgi:perosamine synthetase